ncbi:MAG: hypothetical protein ACYC25_10790 [Paludibacter sp.]
MNDFSALTNLIENLSVNISANSKLIISLSIFVGLNFILAIINILIQFKLKDKDKDINSHNLREIKRIDQQNSLYIMLESLSYYDGNKENILIYHEKVSEINKFITRERLFLTKTLIKLSQQYTDYFLGVLTDYRTKSYEHEMEILETFSNKFNNGQH